jgi:hypothetical protein
MTVGCQGVTLRATGGLSGANPQSRGGFLQGQGPMCRRGLARTQKDDAARPVPDATMCRASGRVGDGDLRLRVEGVHLGHVERHLYVSAGPGLGPRVHSGQERIAILH